MNLHIDELQASTRNIEVYQDTFGQWALWLIMMVIVGGFIIGMILISSLG